MKSLKVLGVLFLSVGVIFSAYGNNVATASRVDDILQNNEDAIRSSKSLKENDRALLLRQNYAVRSSGISTNTSVDAQIILGLTVCGLEAVIYWDSTATINYLKMMNAITSTLRREREADFSLALSNGVVRAGMADPRDLSEIQEAKRAFKKNTCNEQLLK